MGLFKCNRWLLFVSAVVAISGCNTTPIRQNSYIKNYGGDPIVALATAKSDKTLAQLTSGPLVVVPTKNTENFTNILLPCRERSRGNEKLIGLLNPVMLVGFIASDAKNKTNPVLIVTEHSVRAVGSKFASRTVRQSLSHAAKEPNLNAIALIDISSEKGCDSLDWMPDDLTFRTKFYDKEMNVVCESVEFISAEDAAAEAEDTGLFELKDVEMKFMAGYFTRYKKLLELKCGI